MCSSCACGKGGGGQLGLWCIQIPVNWSGEQHHLHHHRKSVTFSNIIMSLLCAISYDLNALHCPWSPSTPRHLHLTIYTSPSTPHHLHLNIYTSPSTPHHLHLTIYTSPSTPHNLHLTIYTSQFTPHHLHLTIYTSPSTPHHLHLTIYTSPSTPHHLHLTDTDLNTHWLQIYSICDILVLILVLLCRHCSLSRNWFKCTISYIYLFHAILVFILVLCRNCFLSRKCSHIIHTITDFIKNKYNVLQYINSTRTCIWLCFSCQIDYSRHSSKIFLKTIAKNNPSGSDKIKWQFFPMYCIHTCPPSVYNFCLNQNFYHMA